MKSLSKLWWVPVAIFLVALLTRRRACLCMGPICTCTYGGRV